MADSSNVLTDVVTVAGAASTSQSDRHVLAFLSDEQSLIAVRAGLAREADQLDLHHGTIRHAIRAFAKTCAARVLVVDIDGVDDPKGALEELAQLCPPDVKVFVVGDSSDLCLYRALVHDFGVTEYMHKPLTRELVQRFVLPHLLGSTIQRPDPRGGHVIAVCGSSGGAGTTTIAVNLAVDLATTAKSHVVLLDLHTQGGATAQMLGARPSAGLRIALEDQEQADALFLDRTAVAVGDRLRLLAADDRFDIVSSVSETGVMRVLDLLRQKFNFVVVDLPMPAPTAMHHAMTLARHVVVVMRPDITGLRGAYAVRQLVQATGNADRMMTVANRANAKGGLNPALLIKGLGTPPDLIIPDLGWRMVEAANLGVPALQHVPALRRHLAPLLREVAGVRDPVSSGSWLQRMFRR
jgi:pilus assembly protein CpaE